MVTLAVLAACAATQATQDGTAAATSGSGGGGGSGGAGPATTSSSGQGGDDVFDAGDGDAMLDPDAACASAVEQATVEKLPVDIIWVIDNSASMAPAIDEVQAGLNDFATLVESKGLDYHVIVLGLRGVGSVTVNGSQRYAVCIPPPLSADNNCGNGAKFFQSSIDIRSTQPLEQLLGTLGQTAGYQPGDEKGGEAWAPFLRASATKTIVVVTDDNARLSATDFESYAGGPNPFNSLTLPPGILDPSWNGLFQDYLFDGIYGWGSDVDPSVKCTFPDQTQPASAGVTYTTLVNKTGGVRAKICEGNAAWTTFFDAVAEAVLESSKPACEVAIPMPSTGTIDYGKVNVILSGGGQDETIFNVADAAACGPDGWYYDDPAAPTKVILCPASCDAAGVLFEAHDDAHVDVMFGCETIVK